jgi:hypothetical protein
VRKILPLWTAESSPNITWPSPDSVLQAARHVQIAAYGCRTVVD